MFVGCSEISIIVIDKCSNFHDFSGHIGIFRAFTCLGGLDKFPVLGDRIKLGCGLLWMDQYPGSRYVMTCTYTCREKRWPSCEKDMLLLHQKFFFVCKEVGLSLDIWITRKVLKSLLQNIYLLLDLLIRIIIYIINVTPL